jgi:chromate reductase
MKVLGISGSLRSGSYNARLLRQAGRLLPGGFELEVFEGLRDVPPYDADEDGEDPPEAVRHLREAIWSADALLIATPEYNSSVPGVLKNALDWASRPFPDNALRGKPALVIGTSTSSFGAVWAQAETRKVLGASGARVLDVDLPVAKAGEAFDRDGDLIDRGLRARLEELLSELAAQAERSVEYSAAA